MHARRIRAQRPVAAAPLRVPAASRRLLSHPSRSLSTVLSRLALLSLSLLSLGFTGAAFGAGGAGELSRFPLAEASAGRRHGPWLADQSKTVADARPGGDTIVAVRFSGRVMIGTRAFQNSGHRRAVALARLSRSGRAVRWARLLRGAHSVDVVVALPDGGALVAGQVGTSKRPTGVVLRVDGRGRLRWRLATPLSKSWCFLRPALAPGGRLIVAGTFRGRYRLPGRRLWRPRATINSFIAGVDPRSGRVLWAKRFAGDSSYHAVAADGSVVVAGHENVAGPRGPQDVFIARFSARGKRIWRRRWGKRAEHDVTNGLAAFSSGAAAVIAQSWRRTGRRSGVHTRRLLLFDRAGRLRASKRVEPYTQLAGGESARRVAVLHPGAIRTVTQPTRFSPAQMLVAARPRVVFYDGAGRALQSHALSVPRFGFALRGASPRVRHSHAGVIVSGAGLRLRGQRFWAADAFVVRVAAPARPRASARR